MKENSHGDGKSLLRDTIKTTAALTVISAIPTAPVVMSRGLDMWFTGQSPVDERKTRRLMSNTDMYALKLFELIRVATLAKAVIDCAINKAAFFGNEAYVGALVLYLGVGATTSLIAFSKIESRRNEIGTRIRS